VIVILSVATFAMGASTEFSEHAVATAQRFERVQLDELPLALLTLSLGLAWFAWRRWREMRIELGQRRVVERLLEGKQEELRSLSRRLTESHEAERRGLAHELHDELGQTLNAIKIEAVGIRNLQHDTALTTHRSALAIIQLTDHVYEVVRSMTSRLRPVALDELGLAGALEHDMMQWRQRLPETSFALDLGKLPDHLDEPSAIALYRVAQEGLTNIVRHAAARHVRLKLDFLSEARTLRLALQDDGRGVELAEIRHGLGLVGMRERIDALGGAFSIASHPGQGFHIAATVPFNVPGPVQ
jgi:signal transduction histidine kinase